MVSFENPEKALAWAIYVQQELIKQPWPQKLLENFEDASEVVAPAGELLYRGLRVRVGIHYGEPTCKIDPITGRMDYFGPVVNRAARVAASANGGN